MELLAKILHEQKAENLWKYDFVDLNTSKKDCFYHSQKLNYVSIIAGRLKLSFNKEQQVNFWQSFEQDIASYVEGSRIEKILTQIWSKSNQVIEKLESEKIKLSPQQIIELEERGLTQKEIAKIARVCERTIRYWKNPTNKPKQKRGRERIMDEDTRAFLYLDFLNNNAKTQKQRSNLIYQEKGIKVSQQVISYNLKKDTSFTRKKATKRYSGLDMEEVKQFLKENYWLYSSPNCLAVDEFSTNLGEAPQYAWSREGCPVEVNQPGQKIASYTVILCVRNVEKQSIVSYKLIKKTRESRGTKVKDFYDFLESINLSANKTYLLLDNASIHNAPKKRKELGLPSIQEQATKKSIILKYLPRYAPQMNPVELCINFTKNYIKSKQPRNEEELREVIEEIFSLLNNQDLTKCFRHCRDYFFLSKNGK